MNLVQIRDHKGKRRVGLVDGQSIVLLKRVATTIDLANLALKEGKKLASMAASLATSATEICTTPQNAVSHRDTRK